MKKVKKRFLALALTGAIAATIAIPSFAEDQDLTSYFPRDTSHPRFYSLTPTLNKSSQVLSLYGGSVRAGTKVVTWKYNNGENKKTQTWENISGSLGGSAITTYQNYDLVINIDRSVAAPQVNIYKLSDNQYADVAIYFVNYRDDRTIGRALYTKPRLNHKNNMFISVTAESTPSSDGTGNSRICRWQTSPYKACFYEIEDK